MGRPRGRGGKNWRGNRGRGGGGGRSNKAPSQWGTRQNYPEAEKTNESFEKYYNGLGIVDESQRSEFWTALRRELPNSFRFAGSKGHALVVQQRLVDYYIPEITKMKFNNEPVTPPTPIEWFPNKLAWQMTTPKNVVRKFAPFASFQRFLVSETSVGNISRQEIVSMIPPLLMDIRPGMAVLDMCAAPGSKTAQLIEMVHGGEEARVRQVLRKLAQQQGRELSPDGVETMAENEDANYEGDWSDDGRSTGLLIANDVEYRRAQLLVHQTKRLNSPNLIVTNHDATMYPSIRIPSNPDQPQKYLKFDRILADVPCSGDGTARKNPNVWKDWIPGNGLGLHLTQVRILVRALQMLKVGGRVVYSTCSMNPVENESVISSAMDRCGGNSKVALVDVNHLLPGLQRHQGMTTWKIMDKQGRTWSSWSEVQDAMTKKNEDISFSKMTDGMFPMEDQPQEEKYPLERCMRVYPHLQDTGAFFIAVLEKLGDIRARPENIPRAATQTPTEAKKSTIIDVVDEISAQPVESVLDGQPGHLKSLEKIVPSKFENSMSDGNLPAAARANGEITPDELTLPSKRSLEADDISDQPLLSSPKKVKVDHDKMNSVAPPPAAELGIPEPFHLPPGTFVEDQESPGDNEALKGSSASLVNGAATVAAEPTRKIHSDQTTKRRPNQPHEEPFKYLDPSHETLQEIFRFYSVDEQFPLDRFMVRNGMGEPVKSIYYTSDFCRDILKLNEGAGLKFVHCGVKMFMKQDAQGQDICRWRIQTEGLPIIQAWIGEERIVRLYKRQTLRKLLKEMFPKVGGDGWQHFEEMETGFGERVRDIGMGCCVLRVERSDGADGFEERLVLPLWRSLHSLNLMLPKEERKAMLLRLYNDDEPLVDHSKERFDKANGDASTLSNTLAPQSEESKPEITDETPVNVNETMSDAMDLVEIDSTKEARQLDSDVAVDAIEDDGGEVLADVED